MAVHKKYPALGRGLDALISTKEVHTDGSSTINEIELDKISPNPNQPRRDFDPESLRELADSIAEIGIVQPITLRKMEDDTFQIIAGERRWRASKQAGLHTIPAYIRTADDENVMEMALIENIQREDLNSVEIALAYQHLIEQYNLTQEKLSERIGKNRSTITNYLRLLRLPAPIQMALQNKDIDMGHARALLALDNPTLQIKLFQQIIQENLSVRKVEEMVKALTEGESVKSGGKKITPKGARLPEEYNVLKQSLSKFFQAKVQLTCSDKGKGKISIPFANEEELDTEVKIFQNALDFSNIKIRDCIVPRTEVVAVDVTASLEDLKNVFVESGISKIIVYDGNIDNVIGYIHSSEMFRNPADWRNNVKEVPIVPETMAAHKLMKLFMQQKKTIAVVVDEFGGTSGIVSLEDLVEEIFGDIEDEHDNTSYICKQIGEHEYVLSARLEIEKVNETFNLELPESDEYLTIGGLILNRYQSFPKLHEVIEVDNYQFKIIKVTATKIELVRLKVIE